MNSSYMLTLDEKLMLLGNRQNKRYTEEQINFIKTAPINDVLSMSTAGSGKTSTMIDTIIMATDHFCIDPERINVMSYTVRATSEIKERYKRVCKMINTRVKPIKFRTLNSMAYDIVSKYYKVIGLSSVRFTENTDIYEQSKFISDYLDQVGVKYNFQSLGMLSRLIIELDNRFIYDDVEVMDTYSYKLLRNKMNISGRTINALREAIYRISKVSGVCSVSQQFMYAIEIIEKSQAARDEYKNSYDIMMVDEVQDMSTIQLILLNKLANRLVMIGDVDQQIYGFRGASSSTIACIKSMRPNILRCNLTVSFRCTEQIAELARKIIAPNSYGTEPMKTIKEGSEPEIIKEGMDYIVDKIAKKFYDNNEKFVGSQMILYRNNYSAYEVVSKLYDRGVPVRNVKYVSFKDMPKIKNIFNLIRYVKDQKNHSNYGYLLKEFLPELSRKSDILQKTFQDPELSKTPFLQLQLSLSNYEEVRNFFDTVSYLEEEIMLDGSAYDIFLDLYNMYLKNGLRGYYEFIGTDPERIASLAKEVMGSKTLSQFITSEEDKSFSIIAWTKDNYGIECMTMHSSKGTEADEVYILDTGSDTIPNEKRLARYIQADSLEELDNYLNNERSLLFVAVTRAKGDLVIQYDRDLTKLICDPYNEVLSRRSSNVDKENEAERIINGFNSFVERTKIK